MFKTALFTAVLSFQFSVRGFAADVWPGRSWDGIADPTTVGYWRAGLPHVKDVTRGYKTSAMMVVVGGRVLLDYGDTAEVENGTIRLDETLGELGFTDVGGLLDLEKRATGENLMVIPRLDMVIAHKVVICDGTAPDVWVDYTIFSKIVDAIVAARCTGACH